MIRPSPSSSWILSTLAGFAVMVGCGGDATTEGDPCLGVVCDAPPSACHAEVGTCASGVCSYAVRAGLSCDDGDACTASDTCLAEGSCAGSAVACQTPPASACDGDTLLVYGANGRCEAGGCHYDPSSVACADGCQDGQCLGDPCAGVTCNQPPSGCYAAVGLCRDGVCDYELDDGASCDDADPCTTADVCTSGTCGGAAKTCTTPPEPTCKDAQTLRTSESTGTCEAGACRYTERLVTCGFGCLEVEGKGRCAGDPCADVVCDEAAAAECKDANTLETPAAIGTCAGGTCSYTTTTTACIHGCEAGAAGAAARCKAPTGLVIAELRYDSQGFPDTDAFVEIHGPPGTRLDGVTLVAVNGNGGGDYATIALSGTLDASGRFVIAHPNASSEVTAVADLLDAKVDFQNGPDSAQLRFATQVLDAVAYGTFEAGDIARGEGTPHVGTAVGESLARDHLDTDTDDNARDFKAGPATPGLPTPLPEVAPEVALGCPASGEPGQSLSFDAGASTGDIATVSFDFGDGTAPQTSALRTATHAFASEGSYTVTATATSPGGQVDQASCGVAIEAAEVPVVYSSARQCFASGDSYLYYVVSDPVAPTTDLKLTVKYSGLSSYGVRPYTIQVQTGANTWVSIATTHPSKLATQTQNFRIDRATAQQAITAMGWLRFRWSYLTNGATNNCLELSVTYNCEACFECPPGQLDLGLDCQPVTEPYDYTILEHPNGLCSSTSQNELYFPGTPTATGDATLTVQSLGCGAATARLRIYTNNAGQIDLGNGNAGNCSYGTATYTVPKAYLTQAVTADHQIRFSWSITDTCAAGTGCSNANDPCVRNMRMTFPR
jgi:PKD repeat protein